MEDERMHGFTQYTPTRIIFGKETQKQAGELAKSLKASKVFVVYGGGSVVRSGLLDEVTASLEEAGLEYMTVGGVKPNPRLSFAREAVKKSIEFGTDFVLAVGGGSVIDGAKAASVLIEKETSIQKYHNTGEKVPKKHLPLIVIPTTAGTGSEVTNVSVLTNRKQGIKAPIASESFYSQYAIVDPTLTWSMPQDLTASAGIDVLAHAVEGYNKFCG